MPSYRNTKAVDYKKMNADAAEERASQKQYAGEALEKHRESTMRTGKGHLTRKGKQTMERVAAGGESRKAPVSTTKAPQGSWADLVQGVSNVLRKAKAGTAKLSDPEFGRKRER